MSLDHSCTVPVIFPSVSLCVFLCACFTLKIIRLCFSFFLLDTSWSHLKEGSPPRPPRQGFSKEEILIEELLSSDWPVGLPGCGASSWLLLDVRNVSLGLNTRAIDF